MLQLRGKGAATGGFGGWVGGRGWAQVGEHFPRCIDIEYAGHRLRLLCGRRNWAQLHRP